VIYAFDFKKIIKRQLPIRKRKPKRIAWIYSFIYPAKVLHDEFVALIDGYKSEMKWNTQRILVERALQIKFGAGIVVENQASSSFVLIAYSVADSRNLVASIAPSFSNPVAGLVGLGSFSSAGFIVKVPSSIVFDMNQMKAFINLYTQQSSYIIQIV
jgi:hypothetical protein